MPLIGYYMLYTLERTSLTSQTIGSNRRFGEEEGELGTKYKPT